MLQFGASLTDDTRSVNYDRNTFIIQATGNTKGGKYHCTIDLLFDLFGLACFGNKTKIVSCHTADSKPVKQEVSGTMKVPLLVFPGLTLSTTSAQVRILRR